MTRSGLMAAALGVGVLCAQQARADVFYTLDFAGTIGSGFDYGAFGDPSGADLTGLVFNIVETFNATASSFASGANQQSLSPAVGSAVVMVGGHSYSTAFDDSVTQYFMQNKTDLNDVYGYVGGSIDYVSAEVFGGNFLADSDLSQSLFLAISEEMSGSGSFSSPTGGFFGNVTSLTLNRVPEPASFALFGVALAGLAWGRRRSRHARA